MLGSGRGIRVRVVAHVGCGGRRFGTRERYVPVQSEADVIAEKPCGRTGNKRIGKAAPLPSPKNKGSPAPVPEIWRLRIFPQLEGRLRRSLHALWARSACEAEETRFSAWSKRRDACGDEGQGTWWRLNRRHNNQVGSDQAMPVRGEVRIEHRNSEEPSGGCETHPAKA